MPTITLDRKIVEKLLGKKVSTDLLKEKITMLGTDLKEITEKEIIVEIFPKRPDLLSEQGFSRALSSFLEIKKGLKKYEVKKSDFKIYVDESTEKVRPFTVCALVKNLQLDEQKLQEIIQLQEKLHGTLCRNRKKLAIGIYPLEHISPPIYFTAKKPSEIQFQPLEGKYSMTAHQILRDHPKGKMYAHLLEKLPLYAIFQDSKQNILSLTPIINSTLTGKVTAKTKDIFVETSGFDLEAQKICLNIVVITLAEMGGTIYTTEVIYKKRKLITPSLEPISMRLNYEKINELLGINLSKKQVQESLLKMGHGILGDTLLIPSYRSDILHMVDVAEEGAIAYGYEKFTPILPAIATKAGETPMEIFKRKIITLCIGLGFLETNTYHLTNEISLCKKMNHEKETIMVKSAKSNDHTILRNALIPSLLEVLSRNKHHEYPQNLFEIGTVFMKGPGETGIEEKQTLSCLICHAQADFTRIKQVLDYLLKSLGKTYSIEETDHPSFIPGRVGKIKIKDKAIAQIGEIHPIVLTNWGLTTPVAALELNVSDLFEMMQ